VLHFWGFTLYTGEIESALFSLHYIANAIVLPLEDEEYQQRAAAILQIKPSFQSKQLNLDTLRNDLTEMTGLMLFKQPTVVYWLREGEEISLTANGKISKTEARKKFFGDGWRCKRSVEVLDLKGMEYWRMGGQC
jgi:acyl-coenzyme A synthetase/AMP-(fatty) acid ligase